MNPTRLNSAGEDAWLRFKQHLEWCDGFALVFFFSDRPQVSDLFRERLAAIHRARITGLSLQRPQSPTDLVERLLPALVRRQHHRDALDAPLWLDLRGLASADWHAARNRFLTLLNAQREPLRDALPRPLILELERDQKAEVRNLVPDLWAIRHLVVETGPWLADGPPERTTPPTHPPTPEPFPLSEAELGEVLEWQRLRDREATDRGALLAAHRAIKALLHTGRLAEGHETARWMLTTARTRSDAADESPEALRDLSVSLNKVGDIERALGRFEPARAAFDESLQIRRQLLKRLGESPEALRDLSVSLNKVGDIERALGRFEPARAAFDESLQISRQLLKRLGESPEALRDLSVSLEKIGDIERALGRFEPARAAFDESLQIRRQLLKRLGESPEALRDLSVSLDNVGNIERALGRFEPARAAFEEALLIAERLAALPGLKDQPDYRDLPNYPRDQLQELDGTKGAS